MDISSLIKIPVPGSLLPKAPVVSGGAQNSSQSLPDDRVNLSSRGQEFARGYQRPAVELPQGYSVIPVGQRPSPEQSADTIVGFIANQIKSLAADGASTERLEQAFNAGLKGFKQGLGEAKNILEGLAVLDADVAAGIDLTEQLVLDGIKELKQQYLPAAVPVSSEQEAVKDSPIRSKVVTAYQQQSFEQTNYSSSRVANADASGIRAQAVAYAESYRSEGAVSLNLRTQDGDIIQLTFSAQSANNESAAFVGGSQGGAQVSGLSYLRESSSANQFSLSVKGELDEGEMDALNQLLAEVSALSDEFFTGDFDKAVDLAMAFEMDASEFSAMSLDLSRSTSVSVLESMATVSNGAEGVAPSLEQLVSASTDGLRAMVDQLLQMMEQAKTFAQPQQLLADLLSNQVAQLDVAA